MTRVTVWGENRQDRDNPQIASLYPEGIHGAIAAGLRARGGLEVRTSTQNDPEFGLGEQLLQDTDVLVYWSHVADRELSEEAVAGVHRRVLEGMGLILLHSTCISRIFARLLGTTGQQNGGKWGEIARVDRRARPPYHRGAARVF